MTTAAPEFEIIQKREAEVRRKPKRARRSWTDLVNAIAANTGTGRVIFVSLDAVTDADVKYLTLALARRGKGERLRTQRETRDGVDGRLLWAVTDGGA